MKALFYNTNASGRDEDWVELGNAGGGAIGWRALVNNIIEMQLSYNGD